MKNFRRVPFLVGAMVFVASVAAVLAFSEQDAEESSDCSITSCLTDWISE